MQNYTLPETARKFIRKNHVRGALLLLAFALLQAAIILSLCRNFSTSNQFVAAVEEVLLLLVYTRWWHRHVAALLWDKDYSGTVLDKEVIAESKRGDARAPILFAAAYAAQIENYHCVMTVQVGEKTKEIVFASPEQMDVYAIGDTVRHFRGLSYPVITGRKTERTLCPLCGNIYFAADRCRECGMEKLG